MNNMGNLEFRAPELMDRKNDKYTKFADIYSIGKVLHALTLGEVSSYTDKIAWAIEACTQKDPEMRTSLKELKQALMNDDWINPSGLDMYKVEIWPKDVFDTVRDQRYPKVDFRSWKTYLVGAAQYDDVSKFTF